MPSRYARLSAGHAARGLPGLVERFWRAQTGRPLTERTVQQVCGISPNTFRAFRNGQVALPPGVILDLINGSRQPGRSTPDAAELALRDAYRQTCRDLFPQAGAEWALLDAIGAPAAAETAEQDRAVLATLTALTSGRLAEAGTLLDTGAARGPAPLLAELYLPRQLRQHRLIGSEEDLRGRCDTASITVVTGDPGTGKTSLLWSLGAGLVQDGRPVVLLNADELHTVDVGGLRAALRAAPGPGPVVLLVDTVDVLLRAGGVPDVLAELIVLARASGAALVMTCRELEFQALRRYDASLIDERASLGGYTDDELPAAVERHARYFFAGVGGDPRHITRSVLHAVARGLPIATVCRVPLTLRMLFELAAFAPDDRGSAQPVDTELDVTDVYAGYWRIRVARDLRNAGPASAEPDLSGAAESLAVLMLATGTPRVPADALDREAERLGPGAQDALAALARRRVVHAEHRLPREFFHQTFFEYAAARAVLRMGAATVSELVLRTDEHPDDLFLAAITQQTMVYACHDPTDALDVDEAFARLLGSARANVQQLAVAAYAQARHRGPATQTAGREVLQRHAGLAGRYLQYLPRTRHDDVDGVLADLTVVWAHGTADLRDDAVHALRSLALIAPARVLQSEIDAPVWMPWYLGLRPAEARRRRRNLLRLVEALAVADPAWSAARLHDIAALVTTQVQTQDALASVLEVAAQAGLPAGSLTSLLRVVPARMRHDVSGIGPLAAAIAAIVCQLWRDDGRDAGQLAAEILPEPAGTAAGLDWQLPAFLARRTTLRALAELIHDLDPAAVEEVLDTLLAAEGNDVRIAIAEQVLRPLLEGIHRSPLAGMPAPSDTPATKIARRRCAAAAGAAPYPRNTGGKSTGALWLHALHRAALTPADTAGLTVEATRGRDGSTAVWLDADALATALVPAALGGHRGAGNALRDWSGRATPRVEPGAGDRHARARDVILNRMRYLVDQHPELLGHLISDARRESDGRHLADALTRMQARPIAVPAAFVQPAIDAATSLTTSTLEATVAKGYTILATLARRHPIAPATVLAGLRRARHRDLLASVLNLFEACHDHDPAAWSAPATFTAAEEALTAAAAHDTSGGADAALRMLYCRSALLDTRPRRVAAITRVRELVLGPRSQAALHPLQFFLSRLSAPDPDAAGDLLVEASATIQAMELDGTGSWKARRANRWRPGIADVMIRLPYGSWRRVLDRLAELEPAIVPIAVDVSVRHRPEPVEHHIRQALERTNQPEPIRAEFRHSLQRKQRETGGATSWPALTPAWRAMTGPI